MTASQLDRFGATAAEAGATYVGVVLSLGREKLLEQVHARPQTPVTAVISRIIDERGGDALVVCGGEQLLELAGERGIAVIDATDEGSVLRALAAAHPLVP